MSEQHPEPAPVTDPTTPPIEEDKEEENGAEEDEQEDNPAAASGLWRPRSPHAERNDKILTLRDQGLTMPKIAAQFGISPARVQQIVHYGKRQRASKKPA